MKPNRFWLIVVLSMVEAAVVTVALTCGGGPTLEEEVCSIIQEGMSETEVISAFGTPEDAQRLPAPCVFAVGSVVQDSGSSRGIPFDVNPRAVTVCSAMRWERAGATIAVYFGADERVVHRMVQPRPSVFQCVRSWLKL